MNARKGFGRSLSRRAFLRRSASLAKAAALGAVASPALVRSARSSSGELNYMGWSGYHFDELFRKFTDRTGITINFIDQPDQDSMLAQARLGAQTAAADIAEPSIDRLPAWIDNDLLQPWNEGNVSIDAYDKAFLTQSGMVNGRRFFLPIVWGTEALTYSVKEAPMAYGTAALADLFDPRFTGKVTLRAHSSLAAMGRVLEAQGRLPRPWLDSYKDPASMRQLWDIALAEAVKHKANVVQFWIGENDAEAAFRTNGCTLGLTWDATGQTLSADGFGFIAPKEGAFGWLQGYVLLKAARNVEQAHEWARFIATPEGSAAYATAFSANPTASGAIDLVDAKIKDFYRRAYPADALSKIWWWPPQPTWFVALRGEYADKWRAA
ncbi:extracellular solute-binding protein [Labrys monachus]|uniref:Spermidine/putrescine transport system substrate-binding protein n=1 Tax=Labrys monachus TaxID=217067 RepID=A0ABU0FQB2_9HYPH|nr:extracellular solute-binding protein [Labrys monachus]MDQ0396299.1 spermidine/putrescine transport system substrate-binding protein [Labrys monachus]